MKRHLLALSLLVTMALRLPAQAPADRAMLLAWDDSLQHHLTIAQTNLYDSLAKAGKSDAKYLRRSLFQIRSAELRNDRPDLELALDNLVTDMGVHPTWPWPEFAMARTFFRMETKRRPFLPSGGLKYAEPYLTGAWRHLASAERLDPDYAPIYRTAADALVPSGDRILRAPEVAFLRIAISRPHPDPDLLLVWGRHLRTLRRYDSAQKVFTRAAFEGGDYSRLALERARTLVALHDSANATIAYWDGAEHLSPAGRELYRDDLSWIVAPDSLATFDILPLNGVAAWLQRFWRERDASAANEFGDRVLEQLRRWTVTMSQFRTEQPWFHSMWNPIRDSSICGGPVRMETDLYKSMKVQPSMPDDPRAREVLVDQRGIVYLRHGEPEARVGGRPYNFAPMAEPEFPLPERVGEVLGLPRKYRLAMRPGPAESWAYFTGVDWSFLRFEWADSFGGYWLKTFPAEDVQGVAAGASFVPELARAAAAWNRSIEEYPNASIKQLGCPERALAGVKTREDARNAAKTDTDIPPISDPWASRLYTYALGQSGDGSGKALITFAFGAKDLATEPGTADARLAFPVTMRVVAYQPSTDRSIELDTLRHFTSNTRAGWVTGWLELPLPGGDWQISVYAHQASTNGGAYSIRRDLKVDQPSAITLSDIVTGRSDAAGWPAPDGQPFPVNPVGVWPYHGSAQLYYEVRGLTEGTSYKTTIQLRARGTKGRPTLELTTADQATSTLTHVRKSLGLEKLEAGEYEVLVRVEANGKKAERTAILRIAPP